MIKKKKVKEGLSDEAHLIDKDHEVQMARAQIYHLMNDGMRLYKLLQNVTESEGLEGWMQSKITLAADYIRSTADYLEYDKMKTPAAPMMPTAGMPESVSAGGMGAGSVATAPAPMGMRKKTLIRR